MGLPKNVFGRLHVCNDTQMKGREMILPHIVILKALLVVLGTAYHDAYYSEVFCSPLLSMDDLEER